MAGLIWWAPWHHPAIQTGIAEDTAHQQNADVTRLLLSGQTDKAIAKLDEYLAQPDLSDVQRVSLLEQQGSAYVQSNDLGKALAAYKQSESLQGTQLDMATAQGLMNIFAEQGNKQAAAVYGRKLITAAQTSDDPTAKDDIPQYRDMIRSFGEQP